MTNNITQNNEVDPNSVVPQWQLDLDRVGFVRKIFLARKWYGGDWWFVVLSALLLLFVIILGIFPQWFAPYDPRVEVGPSLLAPGEAPSSFVLILPKESTVQEFKEIASSKNKVGIVVASASSQALREAVDALNEEAEAQGQTNPYNPRPKRYETIDEGLQALISGEVDGFIASPDELTGTLEKYPELEIRTALREETAKGFVFGTNQIGQDIFSRII